ncbi:hypothetical protein Tco_1541919 [Tanacetum coccineum]
MEMKYTLSSCSDLEEQEMLQMQKQAMSMKQSSMNNFDAHKSTIQSLSNSNLFGYPIYSSFQYEFGRLCGEEFNTFKSTLSNNMDNLDKQLNKEILYEKDSKSALSVIKVQFDKFLHSEVLKSSNDDGRHIREIFKEYTRLEAQLFKDLITEYMESIEKCIVERVLHEQEIQKKLKDRKLQIQECKVQDVKAADASSGNTDINGIVLDKGNEKTHRSRSGNDNSKSGNECSERSNSGNDTDIRHSYDTEPMAEVPNTADYNVFAVKKQHTEQPEFINNTYVMETNDSNITSDSADMSHNVRKVDQHAAKRMNVFANPKYLKKAQWEKPCLYNVQYDKNDLANIFAPESEETIRLVEESRSKLGDLLKPYDYTKLNNLYDLFVPQQHKSRELLYFSKEVKKNIFKTSFQKRTTHLVKRIEYLPTKASMSRSKRAFDILQTNIDNIRSVVEIN